MSEKQQEIDWIDELTVLSPKKGDVIVVKLRFQPLSDVYTRIREKIKSCLPDSVHLLVITDDMDIGMIDLNSLK